MNNIYTAIMKAADQIETHPETFSFIRDRPDCGVPGCALGWIGMIADPLVDRCNCDVARQLLGIEDGHTRIFYDRVNALVTDAWIMNAALCAKGLRLYAAKYHAPKFTGLPDIVREIFTNPRQTISESAQDRRFA